MDALTCRMAIAGGAMSRPVWLVGRGACRGCLPRSMVTPKCTFSAGRCVRPPLMIRSVLLRSAPEIAAMISAAAGMLAGGDLPAEP